MATLLLTAVAPVAYAQSVSGTVLDSSSNAPLRGAVVILLGSDDQQIARTLTSPTGTFRLTLGAAVSIRVLRIGYAPVHRRIDTTRITPLSITLAPLGQALRPVTISAPAVCPSRSDQREALALWSAASDALLAMAIASGEDANSGTITQLVYDRNLGTNGRRIVRQSTRRVQMGNTKPIRAERTPEEFAATGYVVRRGDTTGYYGPNPEVLADSSFAATHCLSIRQERGQVGVAFVPTSDRRSVPDINGVLWLSREPLAVRSLTFEYRGVDRETVAMRAGGRLDFEPLENGLTIIRSWHIRSPKILLPRVLQFENGQPVFQNDRSFSELHETGGIIVGGRLSDGTVLASPPLGSLGGVVRNSQRGEFVANARVILDSTDQSISSDNAGRFSFESLMPGPYILRVADSMLLVASDPDRAGAQRSDTPQIVSRIRTRRVEAFADRPSFADLRLPWQSPLSGCRSTSRTERPPVFVIRGSLEATDGSSLAHAQVRLSWIDSTGNSALETRIDVIADGRSEILMCGVAAGRPLAVSAVSPQGDQFLGRAWVSSARDDSNAQLSTGNLRVVSISVAPVKPRHDNY